MSAEIDDASKPLTKAEAEKLTEEITRSAESVWELLTLAYIRRAWAALGYDSWNDYCMVEFESSQIRMPREQRAGVFGSLRESGLSIRAIAAATGVGRGTVERDLAAVPNGTTEPPSTPGLPSTVTGVDGKQYRRHKNAHVAHNSGNHEWYTPAEFVRAAVEVMGAIDLDPASNSCANEVVGASSFYTAQDNGLTQPWQGRVWLNPPYNQPLIEQFCEKLVTELSVGTVTEACMIVNNASETLWFQSTAAKASAICFPRGRVRFWRPDRDTASPLQGQAVLYFGANPQQFIRTFISFGLTMRGADPEIRA